MKKNYKERLGAVTAFVFDVDGVLTDGSILITTQGETLRRMNTKDGYALRTAIEKGYPIGIISRGTNLGVKERLKGLGITDIYLGTMDKEEALLEYLDRYTINPDHVLYMGDDIPDLPAMKKVGVVTAPQNAAPEIKAVADYISHKNGGKGCVRDVIEQVLKLRGDWDYTVQNG